MLIRRESLQAALAATTSDDTQYTLDAVQIQPDGMVVATDGAILLLVRERARFKDEDFPTRDVPAYHGDPAGPVLVPAEVCRRLIAGTPKIAKLLPVLGCVQLAANGTEGGATLAATTLEVPTVVTIAADDGKRFPAWERVLPKADRPTVALVLGVSVLEALLKAAKAAAGAGGKGQKPVAIWFDVPTSAKDVQAAEGKPTQVVSAVGVSFGGGDVTVTGVVMPCRL